MVSGDLPRVKRLLVVELETDHRHPHLQPKLLPLYSRKLSEHMGNSL